MQHSASSEISAEQAALDVHEELLKLDTLYWMLTEGIKNEKDEAIQFDDFFFLEALYQDQSKEIGVMKPAQAGVSTWAINTETHDARYQGINQIHTLPSAEDVKLFVQSKVNPIIKGNKSLKDFVDKDNADSVGQKQMGRSFLFFKGTRGETSGIMVTSDRNWYDEYDRSNMANISNYASRQEGAASLREKRWISTPTIPDFGIHAIFLSGDQKYWRFRCGGCGHKQHMRWPQNVDYERRCYVCTKCGGELTQAMIRKGAWEAKYPNRSRSTYSITQMIVPWKTCGDLIDEEAKHDKEGTQDYFYNFNLGEPYLRADARMPASLILSNLTEAEPIELNSACGVDVQMNELYAIIGNEEAIYGIAKIPDSEEWVESGGTQGISKWDRLGELMEIYDIRQMVVDATYKPNDVLEFAEKHPGKVYMNWYNDAPKGQPIVRFSDEESFTATGKEKTLAEEMKVLTDRERMIDKTVDNLRKGKRRFAFAPQDRNLQELIKHMKTMYTRTVEKKNHTKKREWANTGKNDYVMALTYFEVAMHKRELHNEA